MTTDHENYVAGSWTTGAFDIPEYLAALGLPVPDGGGEEPGAELLFRLHDAHVHTFPFANVGVLLGHHPGVEPAAVQEQLVRRHRGGYCFEHAQLFAAALEWLGFPVRRALGRVHSAENSRTHMTVVAEAEGRTWLCDPGFGFSVTSPIELVDGATSGVGEREFRLEARDDGSVRAWALLRGADLQHVMDELPVRPADVLGGHMYVSTSADSPFTQHLMVMRHLPDGHLTVTEGARTFRPNSGATEHEKISAAEVVDGVRAAGVELSEDEQTRLRERVEALRG